eukprot:SAG11_NODE_148_length_14747_cov_217.933517_18_plen_164_part_00
MIDPLTAFAGIKTAHSAIVSAIKIGKDISTLSSSISKYAKGEAALQSQAEVKKSSIFSKLSGTESEGIDNFFKKQEIDELRNELRSCFLLYGKKGSWEALQAEISRSRAAQKKILFKQAKKIQMWKDIGIAFLICTALAFVLGVVGFITLEAQAYNPQTYLLY